MPWPWCRRHTWAKNKADRARERFGVWASRVLGEREDDPQQIIAGRDTALAGHVGGDEQEYVVVDEAIAISGEDAVAAVVRDDLGPARRLVDDPAIAVVTHADRPLGN